MKTLLATYFGLFGVGALLSVHAQPESIEPRAEIERACARLEARLAEVPAGAAALAPDAQVFLKGIRWALRFDTKLDAKDIALLRRALKRAGERVDALAGGKATWPRNRGRLVRGFVSEVDGSVQPYGLHIPERYEPGRPTRLDVVLHGSSRPTGMSELRFLARFDDGDAAPKSGSEHFELHPLGRVENGYRWAGETDIFEAIDAVCRNYNIDRDRIVLRGMSMGASGTWHVGLKHPDTFVALGPYCGYVDTYHFSRTPLPNFVKVGPLPTHQEKALHMLDSVDYAANAGVVPAIACMGEKDIFFQAHVLMGQAMEKEGLKMVNLISPGTGHVVDPVTFKEQMRRINDIATKGLDHRPKNVRYVTWTLKYPRCHWLEILRLEEHYRRAEIEANLAEDGSMDVKTVTNIMRFAILPTAWAGAKPRLRINGQEVALPAGQASSQKTVVGKRADRWVYLGASDTVGKRPGVQGPIDDAFTLPFLCVRGTGTAWNAKVQSWSDASLKRFAYEWARYFRGDLRIKEDRDVTDEDTRKYNLILFGDPGSNSWIARVLPKLPIAWTRAELRVAQSVYPSAEHVPLLIQSSPFAGDRYVVLNSGHTFREKELASLNYLLFPRLGDWAVLQVGAGVPRNASELLSEELKSTGFCDEAWQPMAALPSSQAGGER